MSSSVVSMGDNSPTARIRGFGYFPIDSVNFKLHFQGA